MCSITILPFNEEDDNDRKVSRREMENKRTFPAWTNPKEDYESFPGYGEVKTFLIPEHVICFSHQVHDKLQQK